MFYDGIHERNPQTDPSKNRPAYDGIPQQRKPRPPMDFFCPPKVTDPDDGKAYDGFPKPRKSFDPHPTPVNTPQDLDAYVEDGIEYIYLLGSEKVLVRFTKTIVQFLYNVNSIYVPYEKIASDINVDTDTDTLVKKCAAFLTKILEDRIIGTKVDKNFLNWFNSIDGRPLSSLNGEEATVKNNTFNSIIDNLILSNKLFGETSKSYFDSYIIDKFKKYI